MNSITPRRSPNYQHGLSDSPEYRAWTEMKRRCYDPKRPNNQNWKDRGIKVYSRWLESFENFYKDMGAKPAKGYSLDRIDNDGNYEPSNCRWATKTEQNNNKRTNHLITIGNKTRTVQQWCDKYGIPDTTFHNRLRRGWIGEQLIQKPRSMHRAMD